MFLPFLPGEYDPMALPLSTTVQAFGFVGLLLVPFGVVWLRARSSYRAAVAAIGALAVVALLLGFVGLSFGPSLGIVTFAFVGTLTVVLWRRARAGVPARVAPVLFVALPLVIVAARFALFSTAVNWSRERAMTNAAPMIAAIEAYRLRVGRYPVSLLSELSDYDPGIVGIERYLYERNGEAYNLVFEQPSDVPGTREFVIYNLRGEHNISAHDADLLELSQADIDRQRGYYAARDAGQPNWKRFLLD
jgi:hypothetical protein